MQFDRSIIGQQGIRRIGRNVATFFIIECLENFLLYFMAVFVSMTVESAHVSLYMSENCRGVVSQAVAVCTVRHNFAGLVFMFVIPIVDVI